MKRSSACTLALTLLLLCIKGGFGQETMGAPQECPAKTTDRQELKIGRSCSAAKECKDENKVCCELCGKHCLQANKLADDPEECPAEIPKKEQCKKKNVCKTDKDCKGSKKKCCQVCEQCCVLGGKNFSAWADMFNRDKRRNRNKALGAGAGAASMNLDSAQGRRRHKSQRGRA